MIKRAVLKTIRREGEGTVGKRRGTRARHDPMSERYLLRAGASPEALVASGAKRPAQARPFEALDRWVSWITSPRPQFVFNSHLSLSLSLRRGPIRKDILASPVAAAARCESVSETDNALAPRCLLRSLDVLMFVPYVRGNPLSRLN